MEVLSSSSSAVSVTLNRSELRLVNNALNEVVNGVRELGSDSEFATRLGVDRPTARRLLAEVHGLLDSLRNRSDG